MKRLLIPFAAALALSACATPAPTLYQPAAGPAAVGFSESRIELGRYRIIFRGGPGAPPAQVSDYALRRAADLALADGYDWFRVSERFIQRVPGNHSSISFGVGGASFGGGGGVGLGVGTSVPIENGDALIATLEVVMGKGPKPSTPDAYDARGVRKALGGAPI